MPHKVSTKEYSRTRTPASAMVIFQGTHREQWMDGVQNVSTKQTCTAVNGRNKNKAKGMDWNMSASANKNMNMNKTKSKSMNNSRVKEGVKIKIII